MLGGDNLAAIPIIGSVGILAYLLGRAIVRCEFEMPRDVARKRLGLGQPMGDWPHVPDDFGKGGGASGTLAGEIPSDTASPSDTHKTRHRKGGV